MKDKMAARARDLLKTGKTVWSGPAYDGLSARIACAAGFDIVSVGGFAASATLGFPDVGLITMTEALHSYQAIVRSSSVPVMGDGDTGFGNAVNVMRTVREFEDIGLVGIQLEDQVSPKRCPLLGSSDLISLEEAVGKIRAAAEARRNPDFIIKARTDATNIEEAIRRGKAFAEAGADVIYVITKGFRGIDELRELRRAVGIPIGFSILGWTDKISRSDIDSIGGALVGFPFVHILTVAEALKQNLTALKEGKACSDLPMPMMALKEFEVLIGYPQVVEAERRFLPAS